MNMKSLRRRYMGDEWLFVDDKQVIKSHRPEPSDLIVLDEKFKKISIEKQNSPKRLEKAASQERFMKPSLVGLNGKTKYRSPWYINPKYWQQLSMIPEVNRKDIENRAKNLYYFLHKGEPDFNPLASSRKEKNFNKYEMLYSESQKKLAGLQTVHNYKKYLETKKIRLPACLQSLPEAVIPS